MSVVQRVNHIYNLNPNNKVMFCTVHWPEEVKKREQQRKPA